MSHENLNLLRNFPLWVWYSSVGLGFCSLRTDAKHRADKLHAGYRELFSRAARSDFAGAPIEVASQLAGPYLVATAG